MARPSDMPGADSFKHGTRARYVTGCRCDPCREANTAAYHEREARAKEAAGDLGERTETHCIGANGDPCPHGTKLRKDSTGNFCMRCRRVLVWNGLVPAAAARRHLRWLSRQGIGRLAVQAATDIARSVLSAIKSKEKTMIRAKTERLILAVDKTVVADGALVDADPVWAMVRRLIKDHGYTQAAISAKIGQGERALQLGKNRVTARNAMKIKKLLADADGDFLRG